MFNLKGGLFMGEEGTGLSREPSERAARAMQPFIVVTLGTAIRVGRQRRLTSGEIKQSILALDVLGDEQALALAKELQVSVEIIKQLAAQVCEKLLDAMLNEVLG